jgi:hypothetical protein
MWQNVRKNQLIVNCAQAVKQSKIVQHGVTDFNIRVDLVIVKTEQRRH